MRSGGRGCVLQQRNRQKIVVYGSLIDRLEEIMDQVAEDRREEVRELVSRLTGRPLEELPGDRQISFTAEELTPEGVYEVMKSAAGGRAILRP